VEDLVVFWYICRVHAYRINATVHLIVDLLQLEGNMPGTILKSYPLFVPSSRQAKKHSIPLTSHTRSPPSFH
jgi:hypothetical protein